MSTVWFRFPSSSSSTLLNTHIIFQSRNLFKSVAEDLNTIIAELFLQSLSHFQQSNPWLKHSFAHWNTFQSNWATWNGRYTEVYVLQSSQFMRQFVSHLTQPFMSVTVPETKKTSLWKIKHQVHHKTDFSRTEEHGGPHTGQILLLNHSKPPVIIIITVMIFFITRKV